MAKSVKNQKAFRSGITFIVQLANEVQIATVFLIVHVGGSHESVNSFKKNKVMTNLFKNILCFLIYFS